MTVWQTILVYVVIPAAAYGLIALLSSAGKRTKPAPYRPGKEWNHAPVWWGPNPAGLGHGEHGAGHGEPRQVSEAAPLTKGGASGSW